MEGGVGFKKEGKSMKEKVKATKNAGGIDEVRRRGLKRKGRR